jgi:hypothetical protein
MPTFIAIATPFSRAKTLAGRPSSSPGSPGKFYDQYAVFIKNTNIFGSCQRLSRPCLASLSYGFLKRKFGRGAGTAGFGYFTQRILFDSAQ